MKLNDLIILAETIEDDTETMDIYLMSLSTLISRIKDEDKDDKLEHITNRLSTLHDLFLDKLEDMEHLHQSLTYRINTDRRGCLS